MEWGGVMNGEMRRAETESEWAFYWAPWWKGAVWLALYLGVIFAYRQLWVRLAGDVGQEIGAGRWFLFHMSNPVIWIGVLLCWMSMRQKDWRCVGGDANSRRIAFLKTYVPEAASLITLMSLIVVVNTLHAFISRYGTFFTSRRGTTGMALFLNNSLAELNHAATLGLSIPMLTYLAVTRLPSGRKGISGLIVSGLLTHFMLYILNYLGRIWVVPFMSHLRLSKFHDLILSMTIHHLMTVTLIGGLGFFLVKQVNVNVFGARN